METTKEQSKRIASNHLTVMRTLMIQWLKSFFENSANEWGYSSNLKESKLVVIDYRSEVDDIPEKADRVIVKREPFRGASRFVDNRVSYDGSMYTATAIKPRLGYLTIFCESRNPIMCDYIATRIEDILTLHKDDFNEKGLIVGDPDLSDVALPVSGTGFYSVSVSVPTKINREVGFSVKDPSMLGGLSVSLAIDDAGHPVEVKAET